MALLSSYTPADSGAIQYAFAGKVAASFSLSERTRIDSVKFFLSRVGDTISGSFTFQIFAATGSVASALPTGSALATSDYGQSASSVTGDFTAQAVELPFSGLFLDAGVYAMVVDGTALSMPISVNLGPTVNGNPNSQSADYYGSWSALTRDAKYELYGAAAPLPPLVAKLRESTFNSFLRAANDPTTYPFVFPGGWGVGYAGEQYGGLGSVPVNISQDRLHTIDSLLRKSITLANTVDSLLRARYDTSYTVDSLLRAVVNKAYSFDSFLLANIMNQRIVSFDSLLKNAVEITTNFDSSLKMQFSRSGTFDSSIKNLVDQVYSIDSLLRQNYEISSSIDSSLKGQFERTISFDSLLKIRADLQNMIDSLLAKRYMVASTFDSLLMQPIYATYSFDSYLMERKPFSLYEDIPKQNNLYWDFGKEPTHYDRRNDSPSTLSYYNMAVLEDEPTAYWMMDEPDGSNLIDVVRGLRLGKFGSTTISGSTGAYNTGIRVSNTNSYYRLTTSASLAVLRPGPGVSFHITVYHRRSTVTTDSRGIFGFRTDATTNNQYSLIFINNILTVDIGSGGQSRWSTGLTVSDTLYHRYDVSYNALDNTRSLYIDGVLVASRSNMATVMSNTFGTILAVGGAPASLGGYGNTDEFAIYIGKVLSPERIMYQYLASGDLPPVDPGVVKPKTAYGVDIKPKTQYNNIQKPDTGYKEHS